MFLDRPSDFPQSPATTQRLLEEADLLPLLICGVAGVAGYHGFFHLKQKYPGQVFGQRAVKTFRLQDPHIFGCNSDDVDGLQKIIDQVRPKSIWNCGGSCALRACELDPELAHRVNVFGVQNILNAIVPRGIRLLHFSIDLVFSGQGQGNHVETDQPDPVTVYGKTMVEAEQRILAQSPESSILRISLPMGLSFNGHAGAIDWIQHRFAKDRPATLYFDEVRTPTYVECLTEVAEEVLARRDGSMAGLYHAGGPRQLSLYQIAQIVNRVGNYDPEHLIGCPRIDAGPIPPRAGNVTMDSSKLTKALGRNPFLPWPLVDRQVPLDHDWHRERCPESSPGWLKNTLYNRPLRNGV